MAQAHVVPVRLTVHSLIEAVGRHTVPLKAVDQSALDQLALDDLMERCKVEYP